jgi:ribonuclease P protein component
LALPRANRLKHRRDFATVYERGRRRNTANFTLRALRRPKSMPDLGARSTIPHAGPVGALVGEAIAAAPKIGISISRKVSKRAVVRNRLKRQIRAVLRQLLPRISDPWWIVIGVKSTAIECDYWQILQELEQLLVQAEVLNGR